MGGERKRERERERESDKRERERDGARKYLCVPGLQLVGGRFDAPRSAERPHLRDVARGR